MKGLIEQRVEAARRGENPNVIVRMSSGWAVLADFQFLSGWSILLPDPVVPTLNDLPHDRRARFLLDMAALGDAILAVTGPMGAVRMNYAMYGNQAPALHAHVFPRYADEPEAMRTKPAWLYPSEAFTSQRPFDPERDAAMMAAIRERLRLSANPRTDATNAVDAD